LYIFAVWNGYIGFIHAQGIVNLQVIRIIVFVTVLPAVIVAWLLLRSVYPTKRPNDLNPLLIAVITAILTSVILIY
jgi:hypothetical protein